MRFDNFPCGFLFGMAVAALMDGSWILALWLGCFGLLFSLLPDD